MSLHHHKHAHTHHPAATDTQGSAECELTCHWKYSPTNTLPPPVWATLVKIYSDQLFYEIAELFKNETIYLWGVIRIIHVGAESHRQEREFRDGSAQQCADLSLFIGFVDRYKNIDWQSLHLTDMSNTTWSLTRRGLQDTKQQHSRWLSNRWWWWWRSSLTNVLIIKYTTLSDSHKSNISTFRQSGFNFSLSSNIWSHHCTSSA